MPRRGRDLGCFESGPKAGDWLEEGEGGFAVGFGAWLRPPGCGGGGWLGFRRIGVGERLDGAEEGFGFGEGQGSGQGAQEAAEADGFLAEQEADFVFRQ